MWTRIGLLSTAGLLGFLAGAEAASSFDGAYQLYSSARLNETFNTKGATGFCPDRRPGPLTVVQGQARYTTETGRNLEAPVEPNGQFEVRFVEPDGSSPLHVFGAIDGNGTVRARQQGNSCSYDFIWQKQS
jgi:hypothetical protein